MGWRGTPAFPVSSPARHFRHHGTAEQIHDRLEEMIAVGVANPISRHAEQLESLAEIDGLV
jgi:hypothetical protein